MFYVMSCSVPQFPCVPIGNNKNKALYSSIDRVDQISNSKSCKKGIINLSTLLLVFCFFPQRNDVCFLILDFGYQKEI